MMEKRQKETKNSIPQEIIFQVLKELPAKSLLRYRCVSKLWCSIIDSPLFITSHRARSHTRQGGITILMRAQPRPSPDQHLTHFFSINPQGIEPPRLLQTLSVDHFNSIQFVNGLVCFNNNVWNPSTRETLALPPTPITCGLFSDFTEWSVFKYCMFGFAPNSNEYKVVNICKIYVSKGDETGMETRPEQCKVWTLGIGARSLWRNINFDFDDSLRSLLNNFRTGGVCCVNGTIYCWGPNGHEGKILAFDVEHEKFRYISLLDDTNFWLCNPLQVGECFALIDNDVNNVWILDESLGVHWKRENLIIPGIYKSNSIWRRLIPVGSIHRGDEILLHRWEEETGGDEIFQHSWRGGGEERDEETFLELFYYELRSKSLRRICCITDLPGLPYSFDIATLNVSFAKQVECLFRLKG
ncbi:unnamed protein product [Camellia sinensis]